MAVDLGLEKKKVLVTGSGRGIGKAIALRLAEAGCDVGVSDVDMAAAEATAAEIKALGRSSCALKADVSKEAEVEAMFKAFYDAFQTIDVLVNNAGITRDTLIIRMKETDWDQVLDINLKSVFLCCREAARTMMRNRRGKIINIASVVAFMGNPGQANYSASKAGIVGLTKTIAKEYASRGITANAVAPGFIATAMTDALPDNIRQEMLKSIPVGTFGSVDDVATAVAFLASPDTGYITGQVLHVNGGMYM